MKTIIFYTFIPMEKYAEVWGAITKLGGRAVLVLDSGEGFAGSPRNIETTFEFPVDRIKELDRLEVINSECLVYPKHVLQFAFYRYIYPIFNRKGNTA